MSNAASSALHIEGLAGRNWAANIAEPLILDVSLMRQAAAPPAPGRRLMRSVTQEVHSVELVAEAPARFDRSAELVLGEHVGLEIVVGDHRRIARLAGDQRRLAEKITGAQSRHVMAFAHYLDRTV